MFEDTITYSFLPKYITMHIMFTPARSLCCSLKDKFMLSLLDRLDFTDHSMLSSAQFAWLSSSPAYIWSAGFSPNIN